MSAERRSEGTQAGRTFAKIAKRRLSKIHSNEVFGDQTLIRVSGNPRERREFDPTEQVLAPLLVSDILKKALIKWADSQDFYWDERRRIQDEFTADIFGQEYVDKTKFRFSPSVDALCIRWDTYENLASIDTKLREKRRDSTFESVLQRMIGSALHRAVENALREMFRSRELQTEVVTPFTVDPEDPNIYGRADIIFLNPKTGKRQIIDLKFVSDYAFKQITRDGLPDWMRNTPNLYVPSAENRRQMILYMWKFEKEKGYDFMASNVWYFSLNRKEDKETLVMWDAKAKYEAEQLVTKLKEAGEKLKNGEPAEETVQHPYICRKICPWPEVCEPGQKIIAGEGKINKIRFPAYIRKQAQEEAERTAQILTALRAYQPSAFSDRVLDAVTRGPDFPISR